MRTTHTLLLQQPRPPSKGGSQEVTHRRRAMKPTFVYPKTAPSNCTLTCRPHLTLFQTGSIHNLRPWLSRSTTPYAAPRVQPHPAMAQRQREEDDDDVRVQAPPAPTSLLSLPQDAHPSYGAILHTRPIFLTVTWVLTIARF